MASHAARQGHDGTARLLGALSSSGGHLGPDGSVRCPLRGQDRLTVVIPVGILAIAQNDSSNPEQLRRAALQVMAENARTGAG
jgi:hypothetical protein